MVFLLWFLFFILMSSSGFLLFTLNPVQALLWLVIIFCGYSLLLLVLGVEFLCFIIFMVYIGAIMILFLFVVMLLNISMVELTNDLTFYLPISFFILCLFFFNIYLFFSFHFDNFSLKFFYKKDDLIFYFFWMYMLDFLGNIFMFGDLLYTYFSFHFLLASLCLFVAIMGVILLTMQRNVKGVFGDFFMNSKSSSFIFLYDMN